MGYIAADDKTDWFRDIDSLSDSSDVVFGVIFMDEEMHFSHLASGHTIEQGEAAEALVRAYIERTAPEIWLACPYTCQSIVELAYEGYYSVVEALARFDLDPAPLLAGLALLT